MKKIVIAAFVAALFASAFSGCTLHEAVEAGLIVKKNISVEYDRIADTVDVG